MAKIKKIKLHCQPGNHDWLRKPQRGRKPIACPEHRHLVVPAPAPTVERLQCAEGHAWSRPPQRGKKPKYCPEHRPVKAVPVSRKTVMAKAQDENDQVLWCERGEHEWHRSKKPGKPPASCPDHKRPATSQDARPSIVPLAVLKKRYKIDPESERVFSYIEAQVDRPDRTDFRDLTIAYNYRLRLVARNTEVQLDVPAEAA